MSDTGILLLAFSRKQAAQALGISLRKLHDLVRDKQIHEVQIGKSKKIPRDEVLRIAREGTGPRVNDDKRPSKSAAVSANKKIPDGCIPVHEESHGMQTKAIGPCDEPRRKVRTSPRQPGFNDEGRRPASEGAAGNEA